MKFSTPLQNGEHYIADYIQDRERFLTQLVFLPPSANDMTFCTRPDFPPPCVFAGPLLLPKHQATFISVNSFLEFQFITTLFLLLLVDTYESALWVHKTPKNVINVVKIAKVASFQRSYFE